MHSVLKMNSFLKGYDKEMIRYIPLKKETEESQESLGESRQMAEKFFVSNSLHEIKNLGVPACILLIRFLVP